MSPAIIVQTRVGSTRCPGKCFVRAGNLTLIEHLVTNLLNSETRVIVAVPEKDLTQFQFLKESYPIELFGGSETDVLKRYYDCAKKYNAHPVVRVTGDNPFTSIAAIAACVSKLMSDRSDLVYPELLPYGTGVEAIAFSALETAHCCATDLFEREHITQYHYRNKEKFKINAWTPPKSLQSPDLRLTVDTPEDAEKFQDIISRYGRDAGSIELEQIIKDYTTK